MTVSNITGGSARFGNIGYWIDQRYAGHGVMPTAVAMAVDYCWFGLGLHRVEVAIRPENSASLRVVEKLGFAEVGYAPRYLHIDGDWRDHRLFALTVEDVPGGLLQRHRHDGNGRTTREPLSSQESQYLTADTPLLIRPTNPCDS